MLKQPLRIVLHDIAGVKVSSIGASSDARLGLGQSPVPVREAPLGGCVDPGLLVGIPEKPEGFNDLTHEIPERPLEQGYIGAVPGRKGDQVVGAIELVHPALARVGRVCRVVPREIPWIAINTGNLEVRESVSVGPIVEALQRPDEERYLYALLRVGGYPLGEFPANAGLSSDEGPALDDDVFVTGRHFVRTRPRFKVMFVQAECESADRMRYGRGLESCGGRASICTLNISFQFPTVGRVSCKGS